MYLVVSGVRRMRWRCFEAIMSGPHRGPKHVDTPATSPPIREQIRSCSSFTGTTDPSTTSTHNPILLVVV
jgi:hypothetical protein